MSTNPVMSQTMHVPAKWQPRGRGRDPAAPCFTLGPKMEAEMLSGLAPLRTVPLDAIRDGSTPVLNGEHDEQTEDATETALSFEYVKRNCSYLNRPREGAVVGQRFWLEYVDGTSLEGKMRVLLRRRGDGVHGGKPEEVMLAESLEKDANGLRWLLTVPDGTANGYYDLVVQKMGKDGSFTDDVVTRIRLDLDQ